MKGKWKHERLEDVFVLQMGKTPARQIDRYWNNGTNKWVSIADIGKCSKYIENTKEQITDEAILESGIRQVPANTLIMSFKLSLGKVAITRDPLYTNEAIMAFIDRGKYQLSLSFLFHLFKNKDWSDGTNKAVMGITLNKATMKDIVIPIPPLQEQEQIAKNLDAICCLISTREEQLRKLDCLASSRFVEMFGDSNTAMQKWPMHQVQDVAEVTVGVVIQPTRFYVELPGVKAFRSLNIGAGFIKNDKWVYFSEEAHALNQKSALHTGDVVIVRSGYPGTSCVITEEYDNSNAIDIIIAHPKKDIINPVFLAYFNNLPHGQEQIVNKTGGAAQQHFNVGAYKKVRIPNVPIKLQNEFAAFIEQLDKSKVTIRKSIEKFELLYKALLQEYFG